MKSLVTMCVVSLMASACGVPGEELNGTWSVVSGGFSATQSLEVRYVLSPRSGETGVYKGALISTDSSDKCVGTTNVTGTWSATLETFTRTITSADYAVTGCTDTTKNVALKSEKVDDLKVFGLIFEGSYGWSLTNDELTLTKLSDIKPDDKPPVMKRVK